MNAQATNKSSNSTTASKSSGSVVQNRHLTAPKGSNKKATIVGRGVGSGRGRTATRGHNGQKSRSGYNIPKGFEGGQMPLIKRLPKFGFSNEPHKKHVVAFSIAQIDKCFQANEVISIKTLVEKKLISSKNQPLVKIINGRKAFEGKNFSFKVDESVIAMSQSVRDLLEKNGSIIIANKKSEEKAT